MCTKFTLNHSLNTQHHIIFWLYLVKQIQVSQVFSFCKEWPKLQNGSKLIYEFSLEPVVFALWERTSIYLSTSHLQFDCWICNNRSFLKVLQNQRALETLECKCITSIFRILLLVHFTWMKSTLKIEEDVLELENRKAISTNNYSVACLHSVFQWCVKLSLKILQCVLSVVVLKPSWS